MLCFNDTFFTKCQSYNENEEKKVEYLDDNNNKKDAR